MRLQHFGINDSQYERPNQKWVCGWTSQGCPCVEGPDEKGGCCGTAECIPVKRGDRWYCRRRESHGGPCEAGPLPDGRCCHAVSECQPVKSLRAKRGMTAFWVAAATIGFILYIVGSTRDNGHFISPGELSSNHGILGNDCSRCHTAMHEGGIDWSLLKIHRTIPERDSKLCLECHEIGGANLNAHSLPASDLAEITRRHMEATEKDSRLSESLISLFNHQSTVETSSGVLACAICHREHNGRDHRLTEMGNQRCQACHIGKFESFSEGHPEFVNYPFERRTAIIFDHNSHISKHFLNDSKVTTPSSCLDCHNPDAAGRKMLIRDFSITCAACHEDQIRGRGQVATSVAFFQLPAVDIDTFLGNGIEVGNWPEDADGEITPFMRLLLAADPEIRSALNQIAEVDLYDLSDADDDQLMSAAQVVIAIKNMIYQIETQGHTYFYLKLDKLFDSVLDDSELVNLTSGLPVDMITNARNEWFPNLNREMSAFVPGDKSIDSRYVTELSKSKESIPHNRVVEARSPDSIENDEILSDFGDILGDEDDDLVTDNNDDLIELSDDDILKESYTNDESSNEWRGTPVKPPEEWGHSGGWYQENFTLFYRPGGHSDDFIESWLRIASTLHAGRRRILAAADVFSMLTGRQSIGLCSKCHSIDSQSDGTIAVNWHSKVSSTDNKEFTKFSHSAHYNIIGRQGCVRCHELDAEANYQETFQKFDSTVFRANFKEIRKDVCSTCHVPEIAGARCLDCHNYHIGESSISRINSSFSATHLKHENGSLLQVYPPPAAPQATRAVQFLDD